MENYGLEWIDFLISVTLNPHKTDVTLIQENQVVTIMTQIVAEKEKIQNLLKNQVFGITKESQIELLIKNYHSSLIILLDEIFAFKSKSIPPKNPITILYDSTITCLDELLSFIEVRFSSYLSLNERVPVTYLSISKKELQHRLPKLRKRLYNLVSDRYLVDIVMNVLFAFTNSQKDNRSVNFQQLLYMKELLKELEIISNPEKETCVYSALNEFLIYLNFNSKAFTNHFTQKLAEKINEYEKISDKLDQLLIHFKEFNQMHRKPNVILYPQFRDLKSVLSNWFVQEIFYLEKKMHLSVTPLYGNTEAKVNSFNERKSKQKVLCILSSDQIGLVLRAADELRILVAKSMNEVFKTIVPHLSTPYKDDLSYDGMRSKSYVAEERDKQIAIETLEKIIKKIRDY